MVPNPISSKHNYVFKNIKLKTTKSKIIGKGVMTINPIKKNSFIINFTGKKITNKECEKKLAKLKRNEQKNTYFFKLDDDFVIDSSVNGNISMYFNHSCDPNVIPYNEDGQINYYARRNIERGEELFLDYGRKFFEDIGLKCLCGSPNCFEVSF